MNDRFKFRIWRPTNTHIMDWKPQFIYQDILEADYCVIRQDNDVYEFCTGLKDKNGKLIYEGDIVQDVEDPLYVSVVMWDEMDLRWKTKGRGYEIVGSVYPENHIVIGNIHENPELLKESK